MTFRCISPFAITTASGPVVYAGNRLVSDDDPILTTHRNLFEPVDVQIARQHAAATSYSAAAVETATSGPGELRQTSTARRRAENEDGAK